MKKTILATVVGLAAFGFAQVASASGIEEGQLTIWVNGDKSYSTVNFLVLIILLLCKMLSLRKLGEGHLEHFVLFFFFNFL